MLSGPLLLVVLVLSVLFIVLATSALRLHPFLALILAALGVGLGTGLPADRIVSALKDGFGSTLGSIGIVILAGTIIGVILEKTGASLSMANYILRLVGKDRSPLAVAVTGYLVGIPIFCDSGFVVLSPLNNSLARLSRTSMAVMAFALAAPLYIIHCLIPPHPGPTAAAGVLGADLGGTILLGILLGIPAAAVALFWATKFASRYDVSPASDTTFEEMVSQRGRLPHPALSFAPIAAPILLIGLGSFARLDTRPFGEGSFTTFVTFCGDPNVALLLGILVAWTLARRQGGRQVRDWIGEAMASAGPILAITGAGGAFGYMLRVTPVGEYLGTLLLNWELGLLLPFLLGAALKTAQGSSTVAVITGSSLLAPVLLQLGLGTPWGQVFTVLALGAGSMVISHANDSYFWVVAKFSNLDETTAFRTYSVGTALVGCTTLLVILVVARLFGV